MSEEQRHLDYLARRRRIQAAQKRLDVALSGDDEVAAQVRRDWRPMEQFVTQGPDIGHTDDPDEADLTKVPRIN